MRDRKDLIDVGRLRTFELKNCRLEITMLKEDCEGGNRDCFSVEEIEQLVGGLIDWLGSKGRHSFLKCRPITEADKNGEPVLTDKGLVSWNAPEELFCFCDGSGELLGGYEIENLYVTKPTHAIQGMQEND